MTWGCILKFEVTLRLRCGDLRIIISKNNLLNIFSIDSEVRFDELNV